MATTRWPATIFFRRSAAPEVHAGSCVLLSVISLAEIGEMQQAHQRGSSEGFSSARVSVARSALPIEMDCRSPASALVDAQDPAYRASEQHHPDKEPAWRYPMYQSGWVRAHDAIREEISHFTMMVDSLGDRDLQTFEVRVHEVFAGTPRAQRRRSSWSRPTPPRRALQVSALQKWFDGHQEHVRSHHRNEDDLLNPWLRTRIVYPAKLETDHVGLVELMTRLLGLLKALQPGITTTVRRELRTTWTQYSESMLAHLIEEETIGLPLARAYFTQKEWTAATRPIIRKGVRIEIGSFAHCLGSKKAALAFLKQEGAPAAVWHLIFKPARTHYRIHMISHVETLLGGSGPVKCVHKADFRVALSGAGAPRLQKHEVDVGRGAAHRGGGAGDRLTQT